MRYRFFCSLVLSALPLLSSAADLQIDVGSVRIQTPGVTITFGDRDPRGYYWDGDQYRDPRYWKDHHGHRGERYYTGRGSNGVPHQNGGFCPPGQAKKGNC